MIGINNSIKDLLCVLLAIFFLLLYQNANAIDDETITNHDFAQGALIIDMGQSPQTVDNALRPYGYLTDLFANNIPVAWVINPTKAKDGVDFSVDGRSFRGGPFVISEPFAEQARTILNAWPGIVSYTTVSDALNVPVYEVLKSVPLTALDAQNGSIAESYFEEAGVPEFLYYFKEPNVLNQCDDFYAMPHADPDWEVHNNLLPWNGAGGHIWGGCHAVSVLEAIDDPGDADTEPDMNFLSVDGLIDFGDHGDSSSSVYQHNPDFHSDAVMQFLGQGDIQNGSEQIYLPLAGGWRPSARVAVYDDQHPETQNASSIFEEAAWMVYGRAFGDSSRGGVMYEGGHNHGGSGTNEVAAQRAFLNFWLKTGIERNHRITTNVVGSPIVDSNSSINYFADVTGGSGLYSYEWISSCGGVFSSPTSASTLFTAPNTTVDLACNIGVRVKDSCGRSVPQYDPVTIKGLPNLQLLKQMHKTR